MRYYIKTYGCQMNVGDSEKLADILESAGYQAADEPEEADILLVNTCVVRQNAEDKAAWYITSAKGLKKEKPHLVIGVCGCLVTEPGRDVKNEFPHVDIFIAPSQPERLVEFLRLSGEEPRRSVSGSERKRVESITRYITIMTGCDNFCSYCVVPYVRGREASRPVKDIIKEIAQANLVKQPEIFLLGQNVNSYKYGLAKLLRGIENLLEPAAKSRGSESEEPRRSALPAGRQVSGSERIRFMTNHPKDMSDDIIDAAAELPHVCEYFHLPVQHGDDAMLKAMNRGYDMVYYLGLVDKIRAKMPQAAITGDVIVGYPGETDKQFEATCSAIEKINYDACNTAAYSVRPGTAASRFKDDVPDKVKQARLQHAMQVVNKVALEKNKALVGSTQEVLVDLVQKNKLCSGRTRGNKIVKFSANKDNLLGKPVNVKITSAQSWVLKGVLE
ncbi:MAG: tRNA (N6-isopentenyl adenosine(37)-C2)-methylthiotransferase MiaB [Candidatus Saganbacteria bacterium]|nr:tRNA (N6-isopentenyl adenosine(37)-C2)-methylthiotransferase MiaB [Candidatus Saganbacteria bacterium]